MAGSGNDKELQNWQRLARDCQDAGADGLELNFSCPHMDRRDMGSNIGKDQGLCSVVTEAVKAVATVPVWCKLTPATPEIEVEAAACFRGGADAIRDTVADALARLGRGQLGKAAHVLEGATQPDALLVTDELIVVVEGKRMESVPTTSTFVDGEPPSDVTASGLCMGTARPPTTHRVDHS